MPGANESSTVEWHSAQVIPTSRQRIDSVDVFDRPLHADDGVELQQSNRRRGTRSGRRWPSRTASTTAGGSASDVHLQTDRQRCNRVHRGRNHVVHVQSVRPEGFVAEGVRAEYVLALRNQRRVRACRIVVVSGAAAARDRQSRNEGNCQTNTSIGVS